MKRLSEEKNLGIRKRLTAILVAVVFVFGTAVVPAEIYGIETEADMDTSGVESQAAEVAEETEVTEATEPETETDMEQAAPEEDVLSETPAADESEVTVDETQRPEADENAVDETVGEETVPEEEAVPVDKAAAEEGTETADVVSELEDSLNVDLDTVDESEYDGFIYKLEDDVTKKEIKEMETAIDDLDARQGQEVEEVLSNEVYTADSIETIAEVADPAMIECIEPNYIVRAMEPNDEFYDGYGWYLETIKAPFVWDKGKYGSGATVAVLDSGVKTNHEDFAAKTFTATYNAIPDSKDNADNSGHGTAVAGIIAAAYNNKKGLTGIMPKTKIMPVKVMEYDSTENETIGSMDYLIRGINYAASHGADVINISAGSLLYSELLETACEKAAKKGIIIVAAAGNDYNSELEYPASYDTVVSVGSVERDGAHSDFSNYNADVAVTAPGRNILAPWKNGGYKLTVGTSFSCPQVAAMAAMIKQIDPSVNYTGFMKIIAATSADKGIKGRDPFYGYGVIDLKKAYRYMTVEDISMYEASLSATSFTYDGKIKTPSVTVKKAGKTLSSKYYKTTYSPGRKAIGTYKVYIEGRNGYTGKKTLSFRISGLGNMSSCQVSLAAAFITYDGKIKTPSVTVKKSGKTLSANYYRVIYAPGRTAIGTYKVTVVGRNGLLGTKTLAFRVVPPLVKKIKAPKKGKKKLTVRWKAMSKKQKKKYKSLITGYQVRIATNMQFTNARYASVKGIKKTKKVVKGLKRKTTYYVQYRSYKTIGNQTYYSRWSSIKKARTK